MTALPPEKFTNITNELARERNRAAAERTLNAWLGTCLNLIGLGLAVDQILRSLQQRFPTMNPALTQDTASLIGMGVISLGLLLLGFALIQHRLEISSIERHNYLLSSVYALNRLVVPAILLLGVAGLGVILFLL